MESVKVEDLSFEDFVSNLEGNAVTLRQWGNGSEGGGPTMTARVKSDKIFFPVFSHGSSYLTFDSVGSGNVVGAA